MPGFANDDAVYLTRPQHMDALFSITMELASELWVLRDRLAVVEQLLDEHGTLARDDIEKAQPRGEFAEQLARERERFLTRVFDSASQAGES
ncbi:hypothetical protein [Nocardiopsis quinghaiensis]|uniref:hypothetical protein n=1 Tax=Nocardiopsis quinghaiensis TaxID=464995 RepID=UPI00123AF054|nr:hypothetical protein [Nocardiopsis quinghaiensis]